MSTALASFAGSLSSDGKVTVTFKHAGDAPILKRSTFKLSASTTIAMTADQLRKQLGIAPHEPLLLYCSTAFAPPLDETLGDVAQCFQAHSHTARTRKRADKVAWTSEEKHALIFRVWNCTKTQNPVYGRVRRRVIRRPILGLLTSPASDNPLASVEAKGPTGEAKGPEANLGL